MFTNQISKGEKKKIGKKGLDVALTIYHGGNKSSDEKEKK